MFIDCKYYFEKSNVEHDDAGVEVGGARLHGHSFPIGWPEIHVVIMRSEQRRMNGLSHQVGYVPVEENVAVDMRNAVVRREFRKLIDKEPDERGNAARAKTVAGRGHEFRYINHLNAIFKQLLGDPLISLARAEMKNETVRRFL